MPGEVCLDVPEAGTKGLGGGGLPGRIAAVGDGGGGRGDFEEAYVRKWRDLSAGERIDVPLRIRGGLVVARTAALGSIIERRRMEAVRTETAERGGGDGGGDDDSDDDNEHDESE